MKLPAYLVASRQGLYFANRHGWRPCARGRFFGIVSIGVQIFAFRHGPFAEGQDPNSGRIVRFEWDGGALEERETLVEGLDYSCHQLACFGDAFFLADTLNQRIVEYDSQWRPRAAHQLLSPAPREGEGHAHINSVTATADTIRVMFHNERRGLVSEIVEYDRAFGERRRVRLPCHGCHDILPLEDGKLLTCLSPRGEIAVAGGEAYQIDRCWTRGLACAGEELVVGSSLFGKRHARTLLPGFLTFLDPSFRRTARFHLPAAPTQIQALAFDPFE